MRSANVALFTRAWIEILSKRLRGRQVAVALFTRAWIEILIIIASKWLLCLSPSLRGRGLKYLKSPLKHYRIGSPSLRGRGLKYIHEEDKNNKLCVALFTRAWIEIALSCAALMRALVALFTRAWIEMYSVEYVNSSSVRRPLYEGVD